MSPALAAPADAQKGIKDGIYRVVDQAADAGQLKPKDKTQQIVEDRRDGTWGEADQQARFLLIPVQPDVPLKLAVDPILIHDENQCGTIALQLDKSCTESLAKLTKEYLNDSVALVVDGQIRLVAIVRSPITGGKLHVSFCGDAAAEQLHKHLLKQRQKKEKP